MRTFRDSMTRRKFLQGTAGAAAGAAWLGATGPSIVRAEGGDKLRIAAIGVGNMGWADIQQLNSHPDVAINALVDVDENMLKQTTERGEFVSPMFRDFRELFEKASDKFDAVCISTPDHMHAPIAMMALNADKHVYCQKPLTWSVNEARAIGKTALDKFGIVTQMGTQRAANPGKRFAVSQLRSGVVGAVKEIHAFTDRPSGWWKAGNDYGGGEDPTPANLDWDLWLGGAEARPYQDGLYHPGAWRGCTDFGTGAIGDMGCHILDTAFLALGLTYPTSILAEAEGGTDQKYPDKARIHYTFNANRRTVDAGLKLTWYEAGDLPDKAAAGVPADFDLKNNAMLVVGEEGTIWVHMDGENAMFKDGAQQPFETDAGLAPRNHWHLWVDAAMGFGECDMAFPVGARLTETMLLGSTVACKFPGQKLEYDGRAAKITNVEAANAHLGRDYRVGWAVPGL